MIWFSLGVFPNSLSLSPIFYFYFYFAYNPNMPVVSVALTDKLGDYGPGWHAEQPQQGKGLALGQ